MEQSGEKSHPWLDPISIPPRRGSIYPAPFGDPLAGREKRALGDTLQRPGMAAGFHAGKTDGHHLINRSDRPVLYLEVGTRAETELAQYSDIDMIGCKFDGRFSFTRRSGEPFA
jgi:uncharacterized cupin superfamily protein